ncbi:MAG: hypothetical protein IJE74_01315 [Clostridia bacterium]|nr:hypothetical protein [Clostridia bacterium]
MKRKVLSVFLCFVMILTAVPMAAFAQETKGIVDSGICGAQGENLTWTLYDDGELVISGKGEMAFYHVTEKGLANSSPLVPPWYEHFNDIRVITVEEGVTGIGDDAFRHSPRQYHRVNLPKSLEYYYDGAFTAGNADKTALACCYAGTQAEWRKVEQRSWSRLRVNEEHTEVIEIKYRNPSYGWGISDNASDDMYYNGEEPKPYCSIKFKTSSEYKDRIENGGTAELYIRYYAGEHTDAKLVWRTEGDACEINFVKNSPSGNPIEVDVASVTHGEYSVIAELVSSDGTVICSDREDIFSYVPEDMTFKEKTEEFFQEIIGWGAWYIYMFNLLAMLLGMSFFG